MDQWTPPTPDTPEEQKRLLEHMNWGDFMFREMVYQRALAHEKEKAARNDLPGDDNYQIDEE